MVRQLTHWIHLGEQGGGDLEVMPYPEGGANGYAHQLPVRHSWSRITLRRGIVSDPGGSRIGLWQPGTHKGFGTIGEANAPSWFELHTHRYDASVVPA